MGEKETLERAPIWCSVDLRDGNQALPIPMNLEEKLEMFQLLVEIGFKEIEIAFPAANDTEFKLLRTLIDHHMIPDDVTIMVITQAREHIIRRTFEAIKGYRKRLFIYIIRLQKRSADKYLRKQKMKLNKLPLMELF